MVATLTYILAFVAFLVVFLIWLFNSMVVLRNRIENAWSQIDVQLKKRYDLIPNLIETVKGYAKHEKTVFTDVTKARSAAINAHSVAGQAKAENMLTSALKSVFAVAEAYPKLEASKNFVMLQEELSGIEGKIAYARQHYNDMVLMYDNKISKFPGIIVAPTFGFKERAYFEVEVAQKEPVKVKF